MKISRFISVCACFAALLSVAACGAPPLTATSTPAGKTEVLWLGQSAIADYYKPDLVLMPIGGNFTMGPVDAAYATREWLKPKFVIPMHYGANPLGKGTPAEYIQALGASTTRVLPLRPGEKA